MYAGYKEEGDRCRIDGCDGVLGYAAVENCSCHIAPPCYQCVNRPLTCQECGWTDDNEPESRVIHDGHGIGIVEYKPKPLDSTKIDWRDKCHSSCSMLKEGVYPEGTTRAEVEAKVRGTFGGRFEMFRCGKFRYIAYTD